MSAVPVQVAAAAPYSSGFTFGSNVTVGNRITVCLVSSYAGCPPTISDSQGNTYTRHVNNQNPGGGGEAFYVYTSAVIATAGPLTVSYASGCAEARVIHVAEVSGLDASSPFDTSNVSTNTTNPCKAGSVTPSEDGAFIVALFRDNGASSGTSNLFTPMAGWSERVDTNGRMAQDFVQSTAATINPECTVSGTPSITFGYVAVFRAAVVDVAALVVDDQPTSTASGFPIDPPVVVNLTSDGSAVDTGATDTVSCTIIGSGGALYGTVDVAAVAGVATFDNLVPGGSGAYTLRFTATSYATVDSNPFAVTSGSGSTIISGGSMGARDIRRNEASASLRRIPLIIQDDLGAPWAGSVTGVKAKLTQNGTLVSGDETDSPSDIVRVGGALHYVELSQAYTDIAEGSIITARVPAASGRRESQPEMACIIPADSFSASFSKTELVNAVVRATNGADGYNIAKDPDNSRIILTIPGVGTIYIPATFSDTSKAVDAVGA